MTKHTYTTSHEGQTATRKTARSYEFAVWVRHSEEQVEKYGYIKTDATKWGVLGWCGRRDLADKLAAKWAKVFAHISIEPATLVEGR